MRGASSHQPEVQSPEISSSTDHLKFRNPNRSTLELFPRSRTTYRNLLFRPNQFHYNREMHFNGGPLSNVENNERAIHNQIHNRKGSKISTRTSLLCLAILFTTSIGVLYIIYNSLPDFTMEERQHLKIPWNLDDAKQLGLVLNKYKENHYYQVLFGVSITYIFLQTFAIPGSLFLSVLSGFLFSFFQALVLVCTCSAVGASLCFLISQLVGRKLIFKYFPERAKSWAVIVERHQDNLLNYVIFLRVTPFLPNWFINLTAPVIGVPLVPFALGTFIGVAPPSFIALQAGQTLHNMSATDNALSWTSAITLIAFGMISLIPIYFKNRLKSKFE